MRTLKKIILTLSLAVAVFSLGGKDLDAVFAAQRSGEVLIPAGEHVLKQTVEIAQDLRVVFAHGAVVRSSVSPVFRIRTGKVILEGQGGGGTIHCSAEFGGMMSAQRGAVIDVNHSLENSGRPPAVLHMRNMTIRAPYGIDGAWRNNAPKKIGDIEVEKCRFFCQFRGIGIYDAQIASLRITDSLFDGGQDGVYINARIPGGAYVCGNTVRNFGKNGIVLGKGGQIAEGITSHMPQAVVHDNRLVRGGFSSTVKDAYIRGIVVIGHNVSVQGNIVRDVNRGVPVPGLQCGHHIVENGKVYKERMREENGSRIRLAGSAIYLKANRAAVHGNICSNSGWRSVIEIKTGGREHFVSVLNNIVDGRSLAVDDSFAFECNSGRSLWAGNIVHDVPHQAFIVRCGYENTFMNNVIINAKVGFALSGNASGEGELISQNRFIDVKYPVAGNGAKPFHAAGADIYGMPHSSVSPDAELPPASEENAGRMILRGKSLFCCVKNDGGFAWMELAGRIVPEKKWIPVGPELAVNPDQSGKGDIPAELNDPLHPGWVVGMMSAREEKLRPADGHVAFDAKDFRTGGRSLVIKFKNTTGQFLLRQFTDLVPGKRYRASVVVKADEPRNLVFSVGTEGSAWKRVRAEDTPGWQTLAVDFVVRGNGKRCVLGVAGGKTPAGKAYWLDSVSLRELQEEALYLLGQKRTAGEELVRPAGWKTVPGGDALRREDKDGVISLTSCKKTVNAVMSQKVKLSSGKSFRFSFDCRADDKVPVTAFVRVGAKRLSMDLQAGGTWRNCRFEFSVPDGKTADAVNIWAGKIAQGRSVSFRNLSCRELEK